MGGDASDTETLHHSCSMRSVLLRGRVTARTTSLTRRGGVGIFDLQGFVKSASGRGVETALALVVVGQPRGRGEVKGGVCFTCFCQGKGEEKRCIYSNPSIRSLTTFSKVF